MASLELRGICKSYNKGKAAVNEIGLDLTDGEFLVIIGPSGCGKSTLLRLIAGLEKPDRGRILLDGEDITDTDPGRRDMAMVFQDYALYENMTVFQNIMFPLKMRRMEKGKAEVKVREAAELLALTPLLNKNVRRLSGGERQRVAMGRAMVRDPRLLLMDEPLSNLDARLRSQIRKEIQALHERLRTTTVYVTHDQLEAVSLADRIVVMREGAVMQEGTPQEILREPACSFVQEFFCDQIAEWAEESRKFHIDNLLQRE